MWNWRRGGCRVVATDQLTSKTKGYLCQVVMVKQQLLSNTGLYLQHPRVSRTSKSLVLKWRGILTEPS